MDLLSLARFLDDMKSAAKADNFVASVADGFLLLRFYWDRGQVANWNRTLTFCELTELRPELLDNMRREVIAEALQQLAALEKTLADDEEHA